jgi:hypothetical protein
MQPILPESPANRPTAHAAHSMMELDPSAVNMLTSGLNVPGAHERQALGAKVTSQYWPAEQLGEKLHWPSAGVGPGVGLGVGVNVGREVGLAVGDSVGSAVGDAVGVGVGVAVGACVGTRVGEAEGAGVGMCVGLAVGLGVGVPVGASSAS